MSTERILPRIIFVNWRVKLILKQWQLGILEQGMNCSDGNKLHFTKKWQIDNEHFVILLLKVFIRWMNWREIRNFDSKNFREEEWSKIISKMSNLYAVDQYLTFQVNQRYFLFFVNQEDCLIRDYNLQPNIWDTHGISGKRFCKSTSVLFDNLFGNAQSLDFSITGNIPVQASTGRPVIENGDRDNSHSRAPNG